MTKQETPDFADPHHCGGAIYRCSLRHCMACRLSDWYRRNEGEDRCDFVKLVARSYFEIRATGVEGKERKHQSGGLTQ